MGLEEGLLALVEEGLHERRARVTEAQVEEVDARACPGEHDVGLTPVDLGLHPRVVDLGDKGPAGRAELAPAGADVVANGALGHRRAMLLDQALPDALRGVALLSRRLAVGEEPLVDQGMEGPERRGGALGGPFALRRQRRAKRLAHGAPVDAVTLGQCADRQSLVLTVASDLLEQLHP